MEEGRRERARALSPLEMKRGEFREGRMKRLLEREERGEEIGEVVKEMVECGTPGKALRKRWAKGGELEAYVGALVRGSGLMGERAEVRERASEMLVEGLTVKGRRRQAAKEAFEEAFERLGGTEALIAFAAAFPDEFFKLYGKMLPSKTEIDLTARRVDDGRNLLDFEELMKQYGREPGLERKLLPECAAGAAGADGGETPDVREGEPG